MDHEQKDREITLARITAIHAGPKTVESAIELAMLVKGLTQQQAGEAATWWITQRIRDGKVVLAYEDGQVVVKPTPDVNIAIVSDAPWNRRTSTP